MTKQTTLFEKSSNGCRLINGNCLLVMPTMAADSVHSIVTDPPYGLSFMGKDWDHGIPGVAFWTEALRVAKPGAMLLAFGGTRTFHRLAVAIEDAGWDIRDTIMWVYGSGFPKSLDVSKAIDKAAGADREIVGENPCARPNHDGKTVWIGDKTGKEQSHPPITAPATDAAKQWDGWGTALKPAYEPIIMARKPLIGTVAENVLAHGTGAINVNACRIAFASESDKASAFPGGKLTSHGSGSLAGPGSAQEACRSGFAAEQSRQGRWPANLIHDGSEEVVELFPQTTSGTQCEGGHVRNADKQRAVYGAFEGQKLEGDVLYGDTGSAARFFYCAKADSADRRQSKHPTVKPLDMMRYLVRMVTPAGGTVLDPFMGSGTTMEAARLEHCYGIGIDLSAEYVGDALDRLRQGTMTFE